MIIIIIIINRKKKRQREKKRVPRSTVNSNLKALPICSQSDISASTRSCFVGKGVAWSSAVDPEVDAPEADDDREALRR